MILIQKLSHILKATNIEADQSYFYNFPEKYRYT